MPPSHGNGQPRARWSDLFVLAFSALRQQKVRTLLSLLGVIIGSCSLALSLSIGKGIERAFVNKLRENAQLRRVYITPINDDNASAVPPESLKFEGAMSAERRKRLQRTVVTRWNRNHSAGPEGLLTPATLKTIDDMPHVDVVIPMLSDNGRVTIDGKSLPALLASADAGDKTLMSRIIVGRMPTSPSERSVVVHEHLAYELGFTNEADVSSIIGKKIHLEFYAARMPRRPTADTVWTDSTVFSDDFVVAGVVRQRMRGDNPGGTGVNWAARDGDVLIPYGVAQEFFFRAPRIVARGAAGATALIDSEAYVGRLEDQLRARGFYAFSFVGSIEQLQSNIRWITLALALIAAIAMVVSAIGITNTMIMGVLERTREIGVMKAIGARDRYIHFIFLIEGAAIGIVGGFCGILVSWLAHFPGDAIALRFSLRQTNAALTDSIFVYPLWVTLGVPALAGVVAMLAAILPARRASRIDPVSALRHE